MRPMGLRAAYFRYSNARAQWLPQLMRRTKKESKRWTSKHWRRNHLLADVCINISARTHNMPDFPTKYPITPPNPCISPLSYERFTSPSADKRAARCNIVQTHGVHGRWYFSYADRNNVPAAQIIILIKMAQFLIELHLIVGHNERSHFCGPPVSHRRCQF